MEGGEHKSGGAEPEGGREVLGTFLGQGECQPWEELAKQKLGVWRQ